MTLLENAKRSLERLTGWRTPTAEQLGALVQSSKPLSLRFKDDGFIPNNPYWPFVLYRSAIKLPRRLNSAAVWETVFESNGWGDTWRGEIYDYLHYHSRNP